MRRSCNVLTSLDLVICGWCIFGLLCSLILALVALVSLPDAMPPAVAGYADINFVVSVAAIICFAIYYGGLTKGISPRDLEAISWRGLPFWMRAIAGALSTAGIIVFFLPAALRLIGFYNPSASGLPSTLSGAVGIIIYSSFPLQIYSVRLQLPRS